MITRRFCEDYIYNTNHTHKAVYDTQSPNLLLFLTHLGDFKTKSYTAILNFRQVLEYIMDNLLEIIREANKRFPGSNIVWASIALSAAAALISVIGLGYKTLLSSVIFILLICLLYTSPSPRD